MKYFITSDVHSHYQALRDALSRQGFEEANPSHKLILLGDAFDRGPDAWKVYSFLKKLADAGRLEWLMGNHEYQLLKVMNGESEAKHTLDTAKQLAEGATGSPVKDEDVLSTLQSCGIKDFIQNTLKMYIETDRYVFVHAGLPTVKGAVNPNWRNISDPKSWFMACTTNGMKAVELEGLGVPGKTIVCGHVMASWGNVRKDLPLSDWDAPDKEKDLKKAQNKFKTAELFQPFFGHGVIGIDGCVCNTGHLNCLSFEEQEL